MDFYRTSKEDKRFFVVPHGEPVYRVEVDFLTDEQKDLKATDIVHCRYTSVSRNDPEISIPDEKYAIAELLKCLIKIIELKGGSDGE